MKERIVTLDTSAPIWDRFFTVAPLVLIGTLEESGHPDLAPKHMVTPLGWGNYFGFVCTPRHRTYQNVERAGVFTVSYPRPSQLLYASLAASPRCGEDDKAVLETFPVFPSTQVEGVFVQDAYLFLECELFKIISGFEDNSLIAGKIVAAHVHSDAARAAERDDQELINASPLFAYLPPARFATIEQTNSFPFPAGMEK